MDIDYFRCEICGAYLLQRNSSNTSKFPVTRRFQKSNSQEKLLAVRCAKCVKLPYKFEEGQPYRTYNLGTDNVHILTDCNSIYNYWSYGIGHLLEVFVSSPSNERLSFLRTAPIELGFLVDEEVNLIIVAYRFIPNDWNVTPYQWHTYYEWSRSIPPENPLSEDERKFIVAAVDYDDSGKYRIIRKSDLPLEFASAFHATIHKQISQGIPDKAKYIHKINSLYELLINNKVDSMLEARAILQPSKTATA